MKLKNKDTGKIYKPIEYMLKFTNYTKFEAIIEDKGDLYILDGCGHWEYINKDIWEVIEE